MVAESVSEIVEAFEIWTSSNIGRRGSIGVASLKGPFRILCGGASGILSRSVTALSTGAKFFAPSASRGRRRRIIRQKLATPARSAKTNGSDRSRKLKIICIAQPISPAKKIAEMSYLISPADKDSPDWNLHFASALSINRGLGHEQARYKVVAFDDFDGTELSGSDPGAIASRWLVRGGYRGRPQ